MILEYSQMLCTAHRVIDGTIFDGFSKSGRKKKVYKLNDDRDTVLYCATHVNHPSSIWVRQSDKNYQWLQSMLAALCKEYSHRYNKTHKCDRNGLVQKLEQLPNAILSCSFTEPTPAMPDDVKIPGSSIASYRNYYRQNKAHLAVWTKRNVPNWFSL
jgi:hypothetical protein